MNFTELFEGSTPKLPGAVPGIKVMSMDQFLAQSNAAPEKEVAEGNGQQGNFTSDDKVNVGDISTKRIKVGDMVTYLGKKVEVEEVNPATNYARVSTNNKTQNVKLSDLKQLGQGVAEGVATTMPMPDAVKLLRQYGADHFKTTSNELHFYKNGRHLSVDLVMNPDTTRSVSLSSLNAATRGLKGQGVAEAEKNPHTSALGKALYRDLSKEKKASPAQVEKNKVNWAKNPHNPANKEQGVAEDLDANQKRVGQLGPVEKVKNNNIGKLVGTDESIEEATDLLSIPECDKEEDPLDRIRAIMKHRR